MSCEFTVIVRFQILSCSFEDLLRAVEAVIPALTSRPGFRGGQVLAKEDQSEIVTITNWKDRTSYDSLQADSAIMEAGLEIFRLVQSGQVEMQIETYQTVRSVQAGK